MNQHIWISSAMYSKNYRIVLEVEVEEFLLCLKINSRSITSEAHHIPLGVCLSLSHLNNNNGC